MASRGKLAVLVDGMVWCERDGALRVVEGEQHSFEGWLGGMLVDDDASHVPGGGEHEVA